MFVCDVIKQLNVVQAFLKSHRKTQYWSGIGCCGERGARDFPGAVEMVPSPPEAIWWHIPAEPRGEE